MKIPSSVLSLFGLLLLGWVLYGCRTTPPTLVPPQIIGVDPYNGQPTPVPTATPDLSRLSCSVDSDCVLAYRTDRCCSCPAIYNRQAVEDDRGLRLMDEPPDYQYSKWRTPKKACPFVMCAPCPMPPFGLVCDANVCRAAQTWQEIWSACGDLEQNQREWCHANAATLAYRDGEAEQAVVICNSLQGNEGWGTPYSETCLLQVARSIMGSDPQASAAFCRTHMTVMLSQCLSETAFAIGRADVDAALALCNEIVVRDENDRQQKDFCFHNLAMSVAKVDFAHACQICELMSQDVDQCKLDAENPHGVP